MLRDVGLYTPRVFVQDGDKEFIQGICRVWSASVGCETYIRICCCLLACCLEVLGCNTLNPKPLYSGKPGSGIQGLGLGCEMYEAVSLQATQFDVNVGYAMPQTG